MEEFTFPSNFQSGKRTQKNSQRQFSSSTSWHSLAGGFRCFVRDGPMGGDCRLWLRAAALVRQVWLFLLWPSLARHYQSRFFGHWPCWVFGLFFAVGQQPAGSMWPGGGCHRRQTHLQLSPFIQSGHTHGLCFRYSKRALSGTGCHAWEKQWDYGHPTTDFPTGC